MKPKSRLPAYLLLCAGVVACGRKPEASAQEGAHSEEPTAEAHAGQPSPNLLKIDPGMLRDLRITTVPAESRPGGEEVSVLGEVSVNEEAYAEVGSAVAARAVRILVSPGDTVSRGQPLVELQSVELGRARADYWSARARADLARANVARKRELAGRVVPKREVEQAEAEAASAEADLQAALGSLRALGLAEEDLRSATGDDARLVLRAPLAGTVIERNVVAGQMTDPSKPLFRIGDLSRLWLVVHAFERDAVRIRPGSAVRASFPALPGRVFHGHGHPRRTPGRRGIAHDPRADRRRQPRSAVATGHVGSDASFASATPAERSSPCRPRLCSACRTSGASFSRRAMEPSKCGRWAVAATSGRSRDRFRSSAWRRRRGGRSLPPEGRGRKGAR